jgi:tripartite-type tricarboxylate transporter receptor subunit TctC
MRHLTVMCSALLLGVVLLGESTKSRAAYPERPIRFIVPFPPGGANDILARMIGDKLSVTLGQSVVIDNRAGAGGMVGTSIAAKTEPDGYTILLVPASHAIDVTSRPKLPYHALRDFETIARVATGAYILVVPPTLRVTTLSEVISLAKKEPGSMRFASAGVGNATHFIGELFGTMANVTLTHVPYKGGGPALTDLISGRVQMYFGTLSSSHNHAKAGRVRMIAVTSDKRVPAIAEVPTIAESGVPGFVAVGWWGILAPAGAPKAVIELLNARINAIVADSTIEAWMRQLGFEPMKESPAAFRKYIASEIEKWSHVVKASGAQAN